MQFLHKNQVKNSVRIKYLHRRNRKRLLNIFLLKIDKKTVKYMKI